MSTVTICIPAYLSGEGIVPTLESALGQNHTDVRVEVAVEPADTENERVCLRYADDPRLHVTVNEEALGWAEYRNALASRLMLVRA